MRALPLIDVRTVALPSDPKAAVIVRNKKVFVRFDRVSVSSDGIAYSWRGQEVAKHDVRPTSMREVVVLGPMYGELEVSFGYA